jgi:hypothetical protein
VRVNKRFAQLNNERGAATAIVALAMIALVGMVVLVVDVGGLLTLRRRVVAASDAAALAAAQSCAREKTAEVLTQADRFATDNVAEATRYSFAHEGCGTSAAGYVTLGYQANKELFFAPLLGVDDSRPVGHKSTAIWGPALASNPVPIQISMDPGTRRIPCEVGPAPKECNVMWNNHVFDSSTWGFMNLSEWDVSAGANCPNAGASNRDDWITGAEIVDVKLAHVPTYVCMDSGHASSNWADLRSQIGQVKYFPVNDPSQMVTTSGKEKWAVIGFTPLRIADVLRGDDPAAVGTPGVAPIDAHCTDKHSFTKDEVLPLWTIGGGGCPAGNAVDSITNLKLSKKQGPNTIDIPAGVAWTYDPVLKEITWHVSSWPGLNNLNNIDVEFDWHVDGVAPTAGKCGVQPSDANAICLVLMWEGPIIGGFQPGPAGTEDFGIRAIRLDKTK